jgi:hypothetical protein
MMPTNVSAPSVMPLDRDLWKSQLHLSQFINTYYQYRDLHECIGKQGKVLIIGPGAGLDAAVLIWKGYKVTTFDIDEKFSPDILGSCHDMHMFKALEFDVVIASHVLEHLPLTYLDCALEEIARISRYAIIYLPVAGKHGQLRVLPSIGGKNLNFIIDLFKFWETPTGRILKYSGGQHYWEMGYRGFKLRNLLSRFKKNFKVLKNYRNEDWLPSYNFILSSVEKKVMKNEC